MKNNKNSAFSLAIEGSNAMDMKLYLIVVTHFDKEANRINSFLLSQPNLAGDSTGRIFLN